MKTTIPSLQNLDADIRLGKPLGRGSAGTVFSATQTSLDRTVAVKRLHELGGTDGHRHFAVEAEIMARVAHPNIVPILFHGLLDGAPALVMEKVDGEDLAGIIRSLGSSPDLPSVDRLAHVLGTENLPWAPSTPWWKVAATLMAQLARALDHAHRSGVLHHDLKPSNVLVSRNGTALLADFGIAGVFANSEGLFLSDVEIESDAGFSTSGNVAYSAPEEVQGLRSTMASDLYSLGVIARELISLKSPYGETAGQAARIAAIDTGRLAPLDSSLPRDLRAVLDHATATDPNRRYPSSGDFARDLEGVIEGRPISIRREGLKRRARRWVQNNPLAAAVGLLLVALLVAVPTSFQYTRLQSALKVQGAAALAQEHLGLALDGIERMLVDVGKETLSGKPRLDLTRIELMEAGLKFCVDLAGTTQTHESQDLENRIDAVRVKALKGLVTAHASVGNIDRANSHLASLEVAIEKAAGHVSGSDLRRLEGNAQYLRMYIAHAIRDFDVFEELGPDFLQELPNMDETGERMLRMQASVMGALVESAMMRGDTELAVERGEAATASVRGWGQTSSSEANANRELVRVLGTYAAALIDAGQLEDAEEILRESIEFLDGLQSNRDNLQLRATSWNNIGGIERHRKNYDAALRAERKALEFQSRALEVSPHSKKLLFEKCRSQYRIALTLHLQGFDVPRIAAKNSGEVQHLLGEVCDYLELVHGGETSAWSLQRMLVSATTLLGYTVLKTGDKPGAFDAFDRAADALAVAEEARPGDPSLHAVSRQIWMNRVGLSLDLKPETGVEELELYRARFPDDAHVVRNIATMLCVLAKNTRAGKYPGLQDPETRAQSLESLALDRLSEAADLGGLERKLLMNHPAWKRLHRLPRFQEIEARTR